MTGATLPESPTPYPPDPASWRWDAAFVAVSAVTFAALVVVGYAAATDLPTSAGLGDAAATKLDGWLRSIGAWRPLGAGPAVLFYVGLVVALHLTTAAGLFVYARPRTGKVIAFAVGLVFLMMVTTGADVAAMDVYWVAAVASGVWALLIVLGPTPMRWAPAAASLLLLTVLLSGVGLSFLAAATVVLLPGGRRRYLWVPAPAAAAFAVWILVSGPIAPDALPDLADVVASVRSGMALSIGAVSGLGPTVGLVLAVLAVLAVLHSMLLASSLRLGLVGGIVGLVVQFAFIAVVSGAAAVGAPPAHWLYSAAVFIAIALVSWLAHRPLDQPGRRLRLVAVVAVFASIAIVA